MVPITALWLPILLSAVIVFVASSIIHMVLPIHKSDYRKLPEEDRVLDAIRAAGVTPGRIYHFPYTTHKEMKSPEAVERFKRGPVGLLTVIPSGPPAMGKYLGQWFLYCLVIGVFVAYLTGLSTWRFSVWRARRPSSDTLPHRSKTRSGGASRGA